jgi:hypothetical protein
VSVLLPRVSRLDAEALLDELIPLPVNEIATRMPAPLTFTYAPTGGVRAELGLLRGIRAQVLELAIDAGYPDSREQVALQRFEAACARLLHEKLEISPHEAGHREVWACLTAGHLLDIAAWRWDGISDRNRANGHVNRDTFRRLWWRYEILQDPEQPWDEFGGLGEDEIVAIVERPIVTGNPELARAIVRGFRARLEADPGLVPLRMLLMRDAMKRITRLTPFTAFDLLARSELDARIEEVMGEAATAVRTAAPAAVAG